MQYIIDHGGTTAQKMTEMVPGVKNIIENCAGVQSGQRVLIVTDTAFDETIINTFITLLKYKDAQIGMATMTPLRFPYEAGFKGFEEPPDMVQAAILNADVILELTTMWCGLAKARFQATEKGAKYLSMPTIAYPMLIRGGSAATDFLKMKPIAFSMRDKFTAADTIRIVTEAGTDITASIKGRQGRCNDCIADEGRRYDCPGDLEAGGAPIEGTANGAVVVDGMVEFSGLGLIMGEPFKIIVKNGKLLEVQGKGEGRRHAQRLMKAIENCNHPNATNLAEMSWGLNPNAVLSGIELETEAVIGSAHVAFGSNMGYGGDTWAPAHLDCIMKDATVYLDGEAIVENGALKGVKLPA